MNVLLTALLLSSFQFKAPEGWKDLSRCPDEQTFATLPADVAADARRLCGAATDGGTPAMFAVDLRHVDESAVASYKAVVVQGAPVFDERSATSMAQGMIDVAARKGEKLELVEARPMELSKQKGALMRFLRTFRSDRMDLYVVPHEGSSAMLTFIAPISHYEQYQPVFAAISNDVVAPPPPPEGLTPGLKAIAFASACVGGMVGLYFAVLRRRSKRAP